MSLAVLFEGSLVFWTIKYDSRTMKYEVSHSRVNIQYSVSVTCCKNKVTS
jgi:hypothetical protein